MRDFLQEATEISQKKEKKTALRSAQRSVGTTGLSLLRLKDFDGKDGSMLPGRADGSVSRAGRRFPMKCFREPGVL